MSDNLDIANVSRQQSIALKRRNSWLESVGRLSARGNWSFWVMLLVRNRSCANRLMFPASIQSQTVPNQPVSMRTEGRF